MIPAAAHAAIADLSPLTTALVERYGPVAFGVVALLAIWRLIVGPELTASRAAMVTLATAAQANKEAAALSVEAARVSQATAQTLSQIADTLAKVRNV